MAGRMAVLRCGLGTLAVAPALTDRDTIVAGFDPHVPAVAVARRLAASAGIADRVTFEVAR